MLPAVALSALALAGPAVARPMRHAVHSGPLSPGGAAVLFSVAILAAAVLIAAACLARGGERRETAAKPAARRRSAATTTFLLLASAVVLLAVCGPVVAAQPAGQPAPERVEADDVAALHSATMVRILARHQGTSYGSAAVQSGLARQSPLRTHHAVVLGSEAALAVATLAAAAAIALITAAVTVGERRTAVRRRLKGTQATPARHQVSA
jgi:hypothetical protein